ncbi:hypothetical protein HOLleu_21700 [Holothuria leucospilota]|uniref:Uncharacterized protein n=1 Tax=Holothuria leucospilota TaxID=206669 RepID=A0A9Q1BXK9_HOLLE|nr:hypothetical protein HOLleu_21700 [Holothuria leucospilota]
MIKRAKNSYYKNVCVTHSKDQKKLFTIINKLLHKHHELSLPDCESDEELANNFSHFFSEKISLIRDSFDLSGRGTYTEPETAQHHLTFFPLASEEEISHTLLNYSVRSCGLDPVPTSLLKNCSTAIVPLFTNIINHSLESGIVPDNFKTAHVRPVLSNFLIIMY